MADTDQAAAKVGRTPVVPAVHKVGACVLLQNGGCLAQVRDTTPFEPYPLRCRAQRNMRADDAAGQPEATQGGLPQRITALGLAPAQAGMKQVQGAGHRRKTAVAGRVLAVHVGRNAAAYADPRMTWRHRQIPAVRQRKTLHRCDAGSGLDMQFTTLGIKCQKPVERGHGLTHRFAVETCRDIGHPTAARDARAIVRQLLQLPVSLG